MKTKTGFIIFAHSLSQTVEDVDDMIQNIMYFHDNCDFFINHPNMDHPKIRMRHTPGLLNNSNYVNPGESVSYIIKSKGRKVINFAVDNSKIKDINNIRDDETY